MQEKGDADLEVVLVFVLVMLALHQAGCGVAQLLEELDCPVQASLGSAGGWSRAIGAPRSRHLQRPVLLACLQELL